MPAVGLHACERRARSFNQTWKVRGGAHPHPNTPCYPQRIFSCVCVCAHAHGFKFGVWGRGNSDFSGETVSPHQYVSLGRTPHAPAPTHTYLLARLCLYICIIL